jgi:hypothetical protein
LNLLENFTPLSSSFLFHLFTAEHYFTSQIAVHEIFLSLACKTFSTTSHPLSTHSTKYLFFFGAGYEIFTR